CQRIAGRGTDLLVLSGGDGSFMAGVTTLAGALGEAALPKMALIPGGTAATVARNWGMTGDPIELIRRVLRQAEGGASALRATRRPTLRVRATTDEGPEERIGFIFGTGLVAKFFDLYYEDGGRGYGAAARIVARIFAESFVDGAYARRVLDPLPCTVEVDGRSLASPSWSLICAAVVPDLGIRMRVTYRAGEDPSRLHLVASPLSSRALGPRAPRVLAGRSIGGDGHFDDLVREFRVRRDDGLPYVLDGDRLRAREVLVRAGPPIDVLDPPGEDGRAA
ncbi:MAG TPA: diacylglycerol kinase family protein, partial [Candidatus Nanopelagicales bacterium]|nr:diacylglycerol kinase family protein [Candidatus Nanopelagicales bacterium]